MLNEHNWFANGGGICSGSRNAEYSQNVAIFSGYIVLFQWIPITDDDGGLNGMEVISGPITQSNPIKLTVAFWMDACLLRISFNSGLGKSKLGKSSMGERLSYGSP